MLWLPVAGRAQAAVRILFAALVAPRLVTVAGETSRSPSQHVRLVPVVTEGLRSPLFLTHAGDGSGQLFIAEQPGTIRVIDQGRLRQEPFLDLSDRVSTKGFEQGLLGLAFHPDHRRNGRFFVNYSRLEDGATVIAEFRRQGRSLQAIPSSERVLLVVPQPYLNHNGGMVAFGPDGFLYIGMGDGGSRGDPDNRAQNSRDLLGKLLRIDVDQEPPYAVPADNPFVRGGGHPEVFALGLRNPWRFSFDRETGALWLADVGQEKWEEVNVVTKGANYGWRLMEGTHCYNPEQGCRRDGLILPIVEYGHEQDRCSITGGYVYRGRAVPALKGIYLFGDYCSGEIFGVSAASAEAGLLEPLLLLQTGMKISSFGEDEQGEVYVVDHRGGVYRFEPR